MRPCLLTWLGLVTCVSLVTWWAFLRRGPGYVVAWLRGGLVTWWAWLCGWAFYVVGLVTWWAWLRGGPGYVVDLLRGWAWPSLMMYEVIVTFLYSVCYVRNRKFLSWRGPIVKS